MTAVPHVPDDVPDPHVLADDDDELGWDVDTHGRFAEAQTSDADAPRTIAWKPGAPCPE